MPESFPASRILIRPFGWRDTRTGGRAVRRSGGQAVGTVEHPNCSVPLPSAGTESAADLPTRLERRRAHVLQDDPRSAERVFSQTLSPEHLNTGIVRIKLGRALARQDRYAEAAVESRAGYDILLPQTSPRVSWLQTARRDLVAAYDALGQPQEAERFRAELADSVRASP